MAVLSNDKKYVTVQKGDTLTAIALKYLGSATYYKKLATLNGISNPNYLYIGQRINLYDQYEGVKNVIASTQKVIVDKLGLQSNADNTLFATWLWTRSNTDHYEYKWQYDTGDGVWFVGTDGTTTDKQSTYSIPSNAKRVRINVKPISKTYTKNNKETKYWNIGWGDWKYFNVSSIPPTVPSTPSVNVVKYKLTATLNNISSDTSKIEFQIVKNNSTVFKTGTANVKTSAVSYSCTVDAGGKYKVRCRAIRGTLKSDWSEYSSDSGTPPAAPAGITVIKAMSETSVYLDWENVSNVKSYEVQYTTNKRYFDISSEVSSHTVDASVAGRAEITGLTSGEQYFFRVRAINDSGESGWTEIKSITIGKDPAAPTTWSSTTTAIVGEELNLYWVHNSEDGSSQTYAQLELIVGSGAATVQTIKNSTDDEEKDKTSVYTIDTSKYSEGTKIQWRVRTAGILTDVNGNPKYGEWSIQRTIDIYAPPTLSVNITDKDGNRLETIESFPFYITAVSGPNTQAPIGHSVSIVTNETYETVDDIGNQQTISVGDSVYSKHFDISTGLLVEMSAGNINLENNISYTVICTVSMNSGLTTESSAEFTVSWVDSIYEPNAEVSIDEESIAAYIRPYCEETTSAYRVVVRESGKYTVTDEELDFMYGTEVSGGITQTGEQVYTGMNNDGETIYYCIIEDKSLIENVLLSVYRREFDGTFTELATDLDNTSYVTITDPHPSLDYARYRIVAKDEQTGAISYYDIPGVPVGETAAIIQWDEEWSTFDTTNEDELEQPSWSGSLLKLKYNLDVSDSNTKDVELVKYIGREHPVSYHGTQLGEKQTWNVEIPKNDKDVLYTIRRLQRWMGNVYVREPSGSGYWATVEVNYNTKHRDVTIPVSFNITRVEGGI